MNKIDLERTQSRIAQYEALNKSFIAAQQHERDLESDAQMQLDATARKERQERAERIRAEQELEREHREEDEREMVAELARGLSIEEVMHKREKRVAQRAEQARVRDEDERRRQQLEERRKADAAAAHSMQQRNSAVDSELARDNCTSRDFAPPLGTVDDGSALAEVRAAPASIGGLAANAPGYIDPWLRPELVNKTAVAQYRAGGYDWEGQVWRRGIEALCTGLDLRPV